MISIHPKSNSSVSFEGFSCMAGADFTSNSRAVKWMDSTNSVGCVEFNPQRSARATAQPPYLLLTWKSVVIPDMRQSIGRVIFPDLRQVRSVAPIVIGEDSEHVLTKRVRARVVALRVHRRHWAGRVMSREGNGCACKFSAWNWRWIHSKKWKCSVIFLKSSL